MKRKFLCLIMALALCFSLAACDTSSGNEGSKETTAAETTEAPPKEKQFETSDERFQLTADEYWMDAEKLLNIDDATLAIAKNTEAYIVLISEDKYSFSEGLSGYNELVVRQIKKNLNAALASESQEVKLGDHKAFKTTMTGKVENVDTAYVIYSVEINDRFIQLDCWSTGEGSQEKFAEEFDKIAKTLSETE